MSEKKPTPKTSNPLSRRNWLQQTGIACFGAAAGGTATLPLRGAPAAAGSEPMPLPWPYAKLDPDAVASAAYEMHLQGGCGYAVSGSIIGELAKTVGAPYTSWPTALMIYSGAGVAGVGSLCGTLNAAAMVIFAVAGSPEKEKQAQAFEMTREIFNWYAQTPLPTFEPAQPKFPTFPVISRSNLCHASVSQWCRASKCKTTSKEREDRCACLSASVARHTVEMLNARLAGEFKAEHPLPEEVQSCRKCHDRGSKREDTRAQMDCGICHDMGPDHP